MEALKVELGCGKTKSEGYIGVDRFQLEGVDIIADLNQELPFDDNSVDIILACHSLEHVNDLYFTMSEINRICKNKAIMYILAPYYNTSLNIANLYHKSVFNEETFRFFSRYPEINLEYEDYYRPMGTAWGLSQSDNSSNEIEMSVLNMEFFYYKEYYHLTEQERRRARRSLSNVCDQVYYTVVVNKSGKPFTDEELTFMTKEAIKTEPARINSLRNRKPEIEDADSIYKDIAKVNRIAFEREKEIQKVQKNNFEEYLKELENKLVESDKQLKTLESETVAQIKTLEQQYTYNNKIIGTDLKEIENKLVESDKQFKILESKAISQMEIMEQQNLLFKQQIKTLKEEKNALSAVMLDLLKQNESKGSGRYNLFRKQSNLFSDISTLYPQFVQNMTKHCTFHSAKSALVLSSVVSFAQCTSYQVKMEGDTIHYFLIACTGAKLLVEVVQNNTILKQEVVSITQEGEHTLRVTGGSGRVYLRFRTMDSFSIVRILEVQNRKNLFFTKTSLAYFAK